MQYRGASGKFFSIIWRHFYVFKENLTYTCRMIKRNMCSGKALDSRCYSSILEEEFVFLITCHNYKL